MRFCFLVFEALGDVYRVYKGTEALMNMGKVKILRTERKFFDCLSLEDVEGHGLIGIAFNVLVRCVTAQTGVCKDEEVIR